MMNSVETADKILSGSEFPDLTGLKELIGELKGELEFGKARRVLEKARDLYPEDIWVVQQLALCTYKDEERYPKHRFEEALTLLESIGLRDSKKRDAETLSLGGAVYKRLWEFCGQIDHLYESLSFYRAAFETDPERDLGYAANNAAYILDLLAARAESLEHRNDIKTKEAQKFRKEASGLREKILENLSARQNDPDLSKNYWFSATIGEANFGLGNYAEAGQWLAKARATKPKEWEIQSTFRQWVSLAKIRGLDVPAETEKPDVWHEAWQALRQLLGDETANALMCYRGKVGLALSGGGFRASFFHLGVLARLAEADALRGVDVLSTVSGGSILGAHYYLEVQKLLEDSTKKLNRDDYLDIIEKLQKDFLRGVQSNIRMRAFDDFIDNVRMLFSKRYTRSHKLGELYESKLYSQVDDGKTDLPRKMPDLLVEPAQGRFKGKEFRPNFHNWRRRAKVPILMLNTTSLNSGHNWFFTASWMGEPPGLIDIDSNDRYRRLYYWQAPEESLKNFRLGHAAAASSCVPGLFEPLVLEGLYPERAVKLIDGGVFDNQGIQGLIAEGCTLILCSDASGHLNDSYDPADDPGGVVLRTVSVLQDRIREAQYQDLQARLDSKALEGLFFVHTRKDLATQPLDWIGCDNPSKQASEEQLTSYGIAKDLQDKIAALRTDLDSFTEVEAYSLMASGYLMAERQMKDLDQRHKAEGNPGTWGDFDIHAAPQRNWEFLKLKDILAEKPGQQATVQRKDLDLQLKVGNGLFFKAWHLMPALKIAAFAAIGLMLWMLYKLVVSQWHSIVFSMSVGGLVLALVGLVAALFLPAMKWLNPKEEVRSIVIKVAIALTGYLMAKLHLLLFDRLFLERGRLARLLSLK
ncbi:patatin family protein [Methylotuvimicrobium buryatense]|uniref:Patatin family protein n=2 Tax=Methylotuvimicrobium buryatense TaxID=95641 RepID=A0A4P9UNL4_METBY|nr:patatin-like phospholipase family protein [Methylotuvimicrobium buryatense]QCW81811.1 patatin family protein [Methylotuvimicrobium buryatense]